MKALRLSFSYLCSSWLYIYIYIQDVQILHDILYIVTLKIKTGYWGLRGKYITSIGNAKNCENISQSSKGQNLQPHNLINFFLQLTIGTKYLLKHMHINLHYIYIIYILKL